MKRKVNRVGTSTLTVSLPSKWARKYGVNVGDEIDVEEDGGLLVLDSKKSKGLSKKLNLDFSKFSDRLIKLTLNNLYREGYDQLNIKFESPKTYEMIYNYCNNLIGFEIIKKSENYCIVESVTQPDPEKFDSLLRRSFLIIKEGMELINDDLTKGKFENLPLILQYSAKTSQYINFWMRNVANQSEFSSLEKPMTLVLFSLILIKATNRRLYQFLDKKHFAVDKDVLKTVGKVFESYNDFYDLFYKKDAEKLVKLNNKLDLLLEELYKLSNKKRGNDAIVVNIISQMARLIISMISPITIIITKTTS